MATYRSNQLWSFMHRKAKIIEQKINEGKTLKEISKEIGIREKILRIFLVKTKKVKSWPA